MITNILEIRKINDEKYLSLFGQTKLKITEIIGKYTKIEDCFCSEIIEIKSKESEKIISKDLNFLFPSNKTLKNNLLEYKEEIIKTLKEENYLTDDMSNVIILDNSDKILNYETFNKK
jgi:hypothetical protein